MKEIIIDTIIDNLKLLPFLFLAFLIIEFTEHKLTHKNEKIISKAGKFGPLIGSLLGAIPQCGFSVMATNLYATRIITLGTLISVYLSTSDEMLPILIAEKANINIILTLILIKIVIGFISGFFIDLVIKEKLEKQYEICPRDHCDCNHGIIKPALKHTLKIFIFIFAFTFILNIIFHYVGEDTIKNILNKNTLFTPFISGIIGLIPNCGSSILLTELYLANILPFSATLTGLLANSGVALLVLFKSDKKLSECIKIIGIIYLISVVSGFVLMCFSL